MKLGTEVLNKISNLLIQIDRPKSPKRKLHRRIQFFDDEQPVVNCNNRLYQDYKHQRERALERQRQKIKMEMSMMQPFKVDNKHSIFLNQRNNLQRIHLRTPQILRNKQCSVQRMRVQVKRQRQERKKLLHQQQTLKNNTVEHEKQRVLNKIASREQLYKIISRLTQRNDKNNDEKIQYLKQKLMSHRKKNNLSGNSQRIWEQRKIKRQLSSNVLDRFDQYMWNRQKSREELINSIRQRETPFKPNISKQSIHILNKSRKIKTNRLERSVSCKCLSKKNYQNYNQSRFLPHLNTSGITLQPNIVEQGKQQKTLFPYRFC